jgi:hypothetical protein
MAILEGTWIYVENFGKTHIGKVTAIRKNGSTSIPTTNEEILDADRITLCPVYDYMGSLRAVPSATSPEQLQMTRDFRIMSLCNTVEDITMHVSSGNIVFFSDMSADFISAAADAMYAAINAAVTDNSNVILAKL